MNVPHYLETADRIAFRICRDAFWSGDRCNWFGWAHSFTRSGVIPAYRSLEFTLDEGLAGIVLFLAERQALYADPIVLETLQGGLRQLVLIAEDAPIRAGFHAGHAGTAYAILRAARLLSDKALEERGLRLLDRLAEHQFFQVRPDVYAGAAGAVLFLAQTGIAISCDRLIEAARRHAEVLSTSAVRAKDGYCWPLSVGALGYAGFALGSSGVAVALAEVSRAARNCDFGDLITGAIRFERDQLEPAGPGTATPDATSTIAFTACWLRGMAGIAAARIRLDELIPNHPSLLQERRLSASMTAQHVSSHQGVNFSLSDGFSGIGDTLLTAQLSDPNPAYADALAWIGEFGLKRSGNGDCVWDCGAPGTGESPALMHGLAGVGLFYLRLAHPTTVSSPLLPHASFLFEPDPTARTSLPAAPLTPRLESVA